MKSHIFDICKNGLTNSPPLQNESSYGEQDNFHTDCQTGIMRGESESAWGPALCILFIVLPSIAKRNFECSSCIFNMQLVSQMFLQTFCAP